MIYSLFLQYISVSVDSIFRRKTL